MSQPYPILVEALAEIAASNDSNQIAEIARNAARRILSAEAIGMIRANAEMIGDAGATPIPKPARAIETHAASTLIAVSAMGDRARTSGCALSRYSGGVHVPTIMAQQPIEGVSAFFSEELVPDAIGEIAAVQTLARAASAAMSRCVDLGELMGASADVMLERDEVRHRLKNVYASAIGLANLSLPEEHSKEFAQRLRTLAEVHDFLDKGNQERPTIFLRELLAGVLFPYHDAEVPRILAEGPEIEVSSTVALALGLLANELATNALKHGSLSVGYGKILIRWTCRNGELGLWWAEIDGPQADGTASPNQGSKLLRKIVSSHLRGKMEHTVTQSGLRFSVLFPME
jgi:two-component sensor histidine kinase